MNARIFWGIENHVFPTKDEHRNGWYITRFTVSFKDGKPHQTVERKPIAKIEHPSMDHVRELEDAIETGTFVMMPRGWMFDALAGKLK